MNKIHLDIHKARVQLNKTVATVATLIQPGKPLMIIGPYGCGKENLAHQAIESLGLKVATVYLGLIKFGDFPTQDEIGCWIKTMYGNTALKFTDIHQLDSGNMEEMILHEMSNPERRVVITGTDCKHGRIIAKAAQIIKMVSVSNQEFIDSGMTSLYKPLIGK